MDAIYFAWQRLHKPMTTICGQLLMDFWNNLITICDHGCMLGGLGCFACIGLGSGGEISVLCNGWTL